MEKIQDKFGRFRGFIGLESKSKLAAIPSTNNDRRTEKIRRMAGRFRVLIIGRANAGKTTILQKVCNTAEQPEIFDSHGNKIETSVITPTALRGMHNIENELVFRSNPGFIFHDSRGFEAGGTSELDTVKRFIKEKSKKKRLSSQLHVIWYCIPMDDARPFTTAELNFFSKCGTGSVPVVAIFTKFDALEDKAYGNLEAEHYSHENAVMQAPARALADFEDQCLPLVYGQKYPPMGHVYLRDMDKPETDCRELTQTVAAVLDDDNLQRLFVSTQRNNLKLCVEYAIKRILIPIVRMNKLTPTVLKQLQMDMVEWYPNFHADLDDIIALRYYDADDYDRAYRIYYDRADYAHYYRNRLLPSVMGDSKIQSDMSSFIGSPPVAQQMARSGVALAIIAEHSFYLWDREPSHNATILNTAIDAYKTSNNHTAVIQAVDEVFKGRLFWEAKSSRNPKESAFAERLVQIALDNRLPPPQST